jgi:hypothetical protein
LAGLAEKEVEKETLEEGDVVADILQEELGWLRDV